MAVNIFRRIGEPMNKIIIIRVADVIGSTLCISSDDGQKIFDKLLPLLKKERSVELSFERITTIISLFLNVSIGQLYKHFDDDTIRRLLKFTNLENDDMEILECVIDNARSYYANPKSYDDAWAEEEGDDEE